MNTIKFKVSVTATHDRVSMGEPIRYTRTFWGETHKECAEQRNAFIDEMEDADYRIVGVSADIKEE